MQLSDSQRRHIETTDRETRRFRLLTLVAVALIVFLYQTQVDALPIAALVFVYLLYELFARQRLVGATPFAPYGVIVIDTGAILAAMAFSGVLASPIFVLLPASIVCYAAYLGYPTSIFAATVGSLGYVALAYWAGATAAWGTVLAVQVPLFYLAAIFGGYLGSRRLEAEAEREDLRELIHLEDGARNLLYAARMVGRSLRLETVLADVVSSAAAATGLSGCIVALGDVEGAVVRAAILPPTALGAPRLNLLAVGTLPAEMIVLRQEEPATWPSWANSLGLSWVLALPLRFEGGVVGASYLFDRASSAPPTAAVVKRAEALAELTATAIGNALRYQEAESRIASLLGDVEVTLGRLERVRRERAKAVLRHGSLRIDGRKRLAYLEGNPLSLTETEFDLLYTLAESAGQPLSKEALLHRAWGDQHPERASAVDVSVFRLRRKLEADPANPKLLLTVRGIGYVLAVDATTAAPATAPRSRGRRGRRRLADDGDSPASS